MAQKRELKNFKKRGEEGGEAEKSKWLRKVRAENKEERRDDGMEKVAH